MKIILVPTRTDETVSYEKRGNTLLVNGQLADFSRMKEGDFLPRLAIDSPWFDGNVTFENGSLVLVLIIPLPENYSQEQAFPQPLLDVPDGPVELPKPLEKESVE